MSDVNTSTNPGTTAPEKKNPYKEAILNNCTALRDANENGTACYLGGEERDGKLVIKTEKPITNAIRGNEYSGINQLVLQNTFKAAKLKDREVLTFEQAQQNGILIRKNSPHVTITVRPSYNDKTNSWNPDLFREFPKSSCFVLDKNGTPMSPEGTFALAREIVERNGKIKKNRAIAYNEKTSPEKRNKLLESNAYEHKRAIDYLSVTGGNVEEYRKNYVNEDEKVFLDAIEARNPDTPTLDQQKGRALASEKRLEEYIKAHATEIPVIDATNTRDPVDYVGKYIAACRLEAEFVTDKESQREVQNRISQNLQKNFDENNYYSVLVFGHECDEHAKIVVANFRKQSHDQQRGIATERPVVQERPDQNIEMTL